MILLLIILIGFITVRIFFSPLYAVNIAKTSYLEKYNYQDKLAVYGLSDISIKDESFSNYYSSGNIIFLNFRITAKSSLISKYYTTTNDSDEAKDLLACAGFALSRSSKVDIIVAYFLQNKIYDMFEINEILDAYGQPIFE